MKQTCTEKKIRNILFFLVKFKGKASKDKEKRAKKGNLANLNRKFLGDIKNFLSNLRGKKKEKKAKRGRKRKL